MSEREGAATVRGYTAGLFGRTARMLRSQFMMLALRVSIAQQCRRLRADRGWTRRELAKRTDGAVTVWTITQIECGLTNRLTPLTHIAAACDVALCCRFASWPEFGEFVSTTVCQVPPHVKTWDEEQADEGGEGEA